MKIAKIIVGSPDNRKGFFNNVMERAKHLMDVEPNVDCYMIRLEYGLILRLLKRQFKKPAYNEISIVDGIRFRNLWVSIGLFNYLITYRLHRKIVISEKQLIKYINIFEEYDLLSSHGPEAIYLSALVKQRFKIPFVANWHGSDINIAPFHNTIMNNEIKKLLNFASHNFFVSQKLLETSEQVSKEANKSVLYTGPAKSFYTYSAKKKLESREKYNIEKTYVVGFIGNIISIKNVFTLPLIFKALQNEVRDISFVVVGDGKLASQLLNDFTKQNIKNLHILGKQNPEDMPSIINSLDILVLPSFNEGMPRVVLEAQACGVKVVGSNRGGIPEAAGEENCFELNNKFVDNIVFRILELLQSEAKPPALSEKFSWAEAVEKETSIYKNILP